MGSLSQVGARHADQIIRDGSSNFETAAVECVAGPVSEYVVPLFESSLVI